MAKQYGKNPNVDFASDKLMSFGKSFATLNGQPLLKSEAWYDLDALKAFALTDSAYVGQKVFYVDVTDPDNIKVTHYGIEADGSLKELGAATSGDNKSIVLEDGNILSLKNFGKKYYKYVTILDDVTVVEDLPQDAAVGTYCKVGEIWYLKGESAWEITSKYPADGSSYFLIDDGTFPAGLQPKTRLADDGTIELAWYEPSSTTVEGLSEQMSSLSETVNSMQSIVSSNSESLKDKVDKVEGKELSSNDFTDELKDKLENLSEYAQANVIEEIHVNDKKVTPVDKIVNISVPAKVGDLENDKEFIDNTVDNLINYYKKVDVYNKQEIGDLLAAISTLDILVVSELPTEEISSTTIYLVPKTDSDNQDVYEEYIYITSTSSWEIIGSTSINLSNYLQKDGNASNLTVTFTVANTRELPISGETVSVIISKLTKYFTDLHTVAFSGSYNDLVDKPEQITCYLYDVLVAGDTEVSIDIPEGGHFIDTVIRDSAGVQVLTDVRYYNNVVTVSISEALSYDLSIMVSYYR